MSLKAFFKEAEIRPENSKVVISPRFIGEDGKPIEWELCPISEKENAKIKDGCTTKKFFKGRATSEFDGKLYTLRLSAASVVYPDLNDAELQKNRGVIGAEALLESLLLPGEMTELQELVQMVNGFDLNRFAEEQEAIKNS